MWDFSWLQCGHPGGAFYDLSRRVAEAAERGYNTLRIDAFPHFYLQGEHHFTQRGHQRPIRSWGHVLQPGGYTVNIRQKVIELAELCRQHGIWLGLDTWMSFEIFGADHRIAKTEEEKFCREWADTWIRAMRLMEDDGVMERAAWVAPLNEIPIFLGNLVNRIRDYSGPTKEVGDGEIRHLNPELDTIYYDLNTWIGEAIKAELDGTGIPLLYSGVWVENYPARVPAFYDAVDAHFMPDAKLAEEDIIALEKAGEGASQFALHSDMQHWDFALFSAAWERAVRRNYEAMLRQARAFCEKTLDTLTSGGGLSFELICTEAYGPCNHPDHVEVDWSWYKHYNADAARIFAGYPYSGLALSNHAEPLFSLWDDKEWHARGNAFLRSTNRAVNSD